MTTGSWTKSFVNPTTKVAAPLSMIVAVVFASFWYLREDMVAQIAEVRGLSEANTQIVYELQKEVAVIEANRQTTTQALNRIEKSIEQLRRDIIDVIKEKRNE